MKWRGFEKKYYKYYIKIIIIYIKYYILELSNSV